MISADDVRKLGALARIKLTAEEEQKLARDMQNILGYVEQIKKVSADMERADHPNRNVLRADEKPHEPGIHTEAVLAEAPKREGQYVKVKKIL